MSADPSNERERHGMSAGEVIGTIATIVTTVGAPALKFFGGLISNLRRGATTPADFAGLVAEYADDIEAIVSSPAVRQAEAAAEDAVKDAEDALS